MKIYSKKSIQKKGRFFFAKKRTEAASAYFSSLFREIPNVQAEYSARLTNLEHAFLVLPSQVRTENMPQTPNVRMDS